MIYLLYGEIEYLIKENIKKIIKNNNIDELDITRYDLSTDNIDIILNDASSISLFGNKKLIIVNNALCFSSKSKETDIDLLESYLNNINEYTIIIFVVSSLDERKKIVKLVRKNFNVIECNDIDKNLLVKTLFEPYKIDKEAIDLLINRVGDDTTLLTSEIEKIKIYKNKDYTITCDDIKKLTSKTLEINNFKLIDAIIKNDKKTAIELYNERLKLNEEPIAIIIALANQIRIMYQVKQLYLSGYTENAIASNLKIHPYRVKLANQNSKKYDTNLLVKYLYELSTLDINIKSGKVDKYLALELFILSM